MVIFPVSRTLWLLTGIFVAIALAAFLTPSISLAASCGELRSQAVAAGTTCFSTPAGTTTTRGAACASYRTLTQTMSSQGCSVQDIPNDSDFALPGKDASGAANTGGTTHYKIENPLGVSTIQDLFKTLSGRLLEIIIPIAVLLYVWAGVNFLIAAGRPEYITRAKATMWNTTIGLAVIFIGGGFVSLIKSILNAGQ